jgi:hypothetical protein
MSHNVYHLDDDDIGSAKARSLTLAWMYLLVASISRLFRLADLKLLLAVPLKAAHVPAFPNGRARANSKGALNRNLAHRPQS